MELCDDCGCACGLCLFDQCGCACHAFDKMTCTEIVTCIREVFPLVPANAFANMNRNQLCTWIKKLPEPLLVCEVAIRLSKGRICNRILESMVVPSDIIDFVPVVNYMTTVVPRVRKTISKQRIGKVKPQIKAKPKPHVKSKPKPQVKAKPKPKAQVKSKPKSRAKSKPRAKVHKKRPCVDK